MHKKQRFNIHGDIIWMFYYLGKDCANQRSVFMTRKQGGARPEVAFGFYLMESWWLSPWCIYSFIGSSFFF